MLDVYGLEVNKWEPYLEMAERARAKGWYHAYGHDDYSYISMEDDASVVRDMQSGLVPGLLQTSDYVRTQFRNSCLARSEQQIEVPVEIRRQRQRRLTATTNPLELDAMIDEVVLHTELPPQVRRDQLNHLAMVAELPNVTLRVIPRSAGLYDGLSSNFTVLSFPDEEEPDVAYVEHMAGQVVVEKAAHVTKYQLIFRCLGERALSPADSMRLIERLADGT
jgi:hypothetical protein